MTKRRGFISAMLFGGISTPNPARAQGEFPSKPIRLVVPYPAGGGADAIARLLARKMGDGMGQQMLVENRAGAATIIGTDVVAKAPSDGYTIGLVTDSHAINFGFKRKLPYKETDFTPVIQLLNVPLVLLTNSKVPARNLKELVAYAKANPGKLNFASLGSGSPHEIAMLWLMKVAGVDIAVIPYKGISPALLDVVGGQVDLMFAGSAIASQYIGQGKVRAVAVTSIKRAPSNSDLPAIAETYPDYVVNTWYGIVGPAGMPRAVTSKLHGDFARALQSDHVRQQIEMLGAEVVGGSATAFEELIRADTQKWSHVIQITGAEPG